MVLVLYEVELLLDPLAGLGDAELEWPAAAALQGGEGEGEGEGEAAAALQGGQGLND